MLTSMTFTSLHHATRSATRYAAVSFGLDAALLALAFAFAPLDWEVGVDRAPVALTLAMAGLVGLFLAGGYRLTQPVRLAPARLAPLGLSLGIALAWLVLKLAFQKARIYDLNPPALEGFVPTVLALAALTALHRALHLRALHRAEAARPVFLLADPSTATSLIARLRARGFTGEVREVDATQLQALGTRPPPGTAPTAPPRAIVLARPLSSLARPELEALAVTRASGLPVSSAARFEEDLFGYTPLRTPDDPWLLMDEALVRRAPLYLGAKRLLDLILTVIALPIALPLVLACAVVVRLTSRGPAFYRQTRAGLHRRPFSLWKLRTMVADAEAATGPVFAGQDDPRVTRLGRFLRRSRLDELPQLWNVLIGDMSLVGPRPERPELDHLLAPEIPFYALRHLVRPGLTGWAQVHLGYGASTEDAFRKLEHDVYYLKRASFSFDLAILVRTVPVVLGLRGR
jgi:exopolysaccharide biosynthesis polyprenyl glycosylphosphotransferase